MGPKKIIKRVNVWSRSALGIPAWFFIHIPKNGGMSLRRNTELKQRLIIATKDTHKSKEYYQSVQQAMKGRVSGYEHARLRDIHPWFLQRCRPVAVLRNPWARTVSRFTYGLKSIEQRKSREEKFPYDFEAFLEERHEWGYKDYYWHRAIRGWYPQTDYVTNEAGLIATDLLRLEHIGEEASTYFLLRTPPSQRNVSSKTGQSYKDYYTPKTIGIVADWYKADIELFGFDFDTPATRNTAFTPKDQQAYDPKFWKHGYNCEQHKDTG